MAKSTEHDYNFQFFILTPHSIYDYFNYDNNCYNIIHNHYVNKYKSLLTYKLSLKKSIQNVSLA